LRLLFVTHFFPYPPVGGGRIGCFNPIRYLSRRIEIVLVSIVDPSSVEFVHDMDRYCLDVKVHQIRQSPYVALGRGLIGEIPGTAAKYYDPVFGKLIQSAIEQWKIDVVELQHLNTASYRRWVSSVPTLLREHNVEYKVWERQARHANNFVEYAYVSMVAPRIRAYEARVASQFDRCITVSEADTNHLRDVAPTAKIEMIPSGVDTEYFVADSSAPQEPNSMILTGAFDWKPKQHNLKIFLTKFYPMIKARLPNATLKVVGKGVPDELRTLADRLQGVTVTGSVPDVRPYLQNAVLALNYMENGGGIALKVLEAMAMRKPVLSNSLGCEGISVQHGENVFLADTVESFADAAVLLLQNAGVREKIAMGGYRLVQERYAWERLASQFQECYASVLAERRSSLHGNLHPPQRSRSS
jgi:glycosyltransferase involved in cell wall biosynthesis